MRIRAPRQTAGVLIVFLLGAGGVGCPAAAAAPDRNVLLVTIDTLRPDRVSCYNPKYVKTPVLDALAARGALFERAFAHTVITLPSLANILTGVTPLRHGVSENAKNRVPASLLTLAEHLKAQGYAAGAFVGAFPLDSRFGLDQGFDVYDDTFPTRPDQPGSGSERRAAEVVAPAEAWIAKQKGPWFCWIHFWDPHTPYAPPEPYASAYSADPYSGEVAYVDAELGRLLDDLRTSGRNDRTLIVVTADHGESLGEHGELTHGYFAYNSTLHVPLIIAGPGIGSSRIRDPVGHVDLFPTICESLGIKIPTGLEGRSLISAMAGRLQPPRPLYFEAMESYYSKGTAPLRGMIDSGKKFFESPIPELYDLVSDFGEASDLAPRSDLKPYRSKLAEMMKTSPIAAADRNRPVDREALARLRSLGYTSAPDLPRKSVFGPADDLKSFLPFQKKLDRAITLKDQGRFEDAVREFESLIRERKDLTWAYLFLAETHLAAGRGPDAVRALESGVRANPESFTLLGACGELLIQSGDLDSAIGVLEKAISLVESDPVVWDHLGFIYWRKGVLDKAEEYYRKSITLDPSYPKAHADLGALRLTMFTDRGRDPKNLTQAVESFQRAVGLDPAFTPAWRGLGVALKESGKTSEAVAAWTRAFTANPRDSYSAIALASAHLEAGQKDKSRSVLASYLRAKGEAISPEERAQVQALIEKSKKFPS
jgi:arylsulfatase A-like enzyme/Flp pilus assembly protein TadD